MKATSTLSVILDLRCTPDNELLCRNVRDHVLEVAFEVVQVAWWEHAAAVADPPALPAVHLPLALYTLTSVGRATILPMTTLSHNNDAIRLAFGQMFQAVPSVVTQECGPAHITSTQMDSVAVALHEAFQAGESERNRGSSHHHVLMVSTFSHDGVAPRACKLSHLISGGDMFSVTLVFVDVAARNATTARVTPLVSLVRLPLHTIATDLRSHTQQVCDRWAASVLLPHDVPVLVDVGRRQITCFATCAVMSTLSEKSSFEQQSPSTIVHGGCFVESPYQSSRHPHQSSSAAQRLRVERCIPAAVVDESLFLGEAWHVVASPVDPASRSWWGALFEATVKAAQEPSVLMLSSSSGFFAAQGSLMLQHHMFIGMFDACGASFLLRFVAPRESRRCLPTPMVVPFQSVPPSMVEEMANAIAVHSHDSQAADWRVEPGGAVVVFGFLDLAKCHHKVQVTSSHQHVTASHSRQARATQRQGGALHERLSVCK